MSDERRVVAVLYLPMRVSTWTTAVQAFLDEFPDAVTGSELDGQVVKIWNRPE